MKGQFLIYGANGFVGEAITRLAKSRGLSPIIAARNVDKIELLSKELGLDYRIISLEDKNKLEEALKEVDLVLNCAGPYMHTYKAMIEACLQTNTHYLDITGEIPVFEALSQLDLQAKDKGIMILPGVGFDVVPTDCLAVYLKEKLPTATHLTLAFYSKGHAGLPPGTMKTMIELIPFGNRIRKDGALVKPKKGIKTRMIDFGHGPIEATRLTWGDVFTAYHSTGIENIEVYSVFPKKIVKQMKAIEYLRPIFSLPFVQKFLKRNMKGGSTAKERSKTIVSVWGEVKDEKGNKVEGRLQGPEAGVIWTSYCALAAVNRVMAGDFSAGYQTPAKVYGADFVLECEGVHREDIS